MKLLSTTKHVFKSLFFLLAICISSNAIAQFQEVEVGINGLTCSMCSYSVENSIKKLSYINMVKMDLNKNIAQVHSDKGTNINFLEVAERVKKSGFSVRYLSFKLPEDIKPNANGMFSLGGKQFCLINTKSTSLEAGSNLKLVGEGYLPKSELKEQLSNLTSEQKKMLKEGQAFFVLHEN